MSNVYGQGIWDEYKSGKYIYQRYRVVIDGVQKSFYGKTKSEAMKKFRQYKEKNTKTSKKTSHTLYDVAIMAIEAKKAQIKATTYDFYRYAAESLLKGGIGRKQIYSLTEAELQDYISSLKDTVTLSTIKRQRIILKITYEYAVDHGFVAENLMKRVKLPHKANVEKEERQPVFLTKEERHLLENEAVRKNKKGEYHSGKIGEYAYGHSARAVAFILHTGLRVSELIALSWDDVNMKNKTIRVRRNAQKVRNYDEDREKAYDFKLSSPKRESSVRIIPLDDKAMEMISILDEDRNGDFVFHSKTGSPLDRNHIARALNTMIKHTEIKQNPSPHDLRHTYASELIAAGTDIKLVSELLGHSDVAITLNIYVHPSEEAFERVRGILD